LAGLFHSLWNAGKSNNQLRFIDENNEPDLEFISTHLGDILKANSSTGCFITQGFICRNHLGEIDNLQRGGSDYTATIIGSVLEVDEIQIWTDIDGMHSTTPITHLSFDEAGELAYFGAKILHPTCILPAKKKNVPVRIKNTLDPTADGTLISHKSINQKIKAIAAKDGITAVKIQSDRMLQAYGFLKRVFEIFETHKTSVDMITTSEVAVSLTIDNDKCLHLILDDLRQFSTVEVDTNLSIICVVGDFIADHKGYGQGIFEALNQVPLRMISYGGSKHNISVLVNALDKENALVSLHKNLFHEN
jgi:aspartate kinase